MTTATVTPTKREALEARLAETRAALERATHESTALEARLGEALVEGRSGDAARARREMADHEESVAGLRASVPALEKRIADALAEEERARQEAERARLDGERRARLAAALKFDAALAAAERAFVEWRSHLDGLTGDPKRRVWNAVGAAAPELYAYLGGYPHPRWIAPLAEAERPRVPASQEK